jgi:hypothetical protein
LDDASRALFGDPLTDRGGGFGLWALRGSLATSVGQFDHHAHRHTDADANPNSDSTACLR